MAKPTRPPGLARNAAANWITFLFVAGVSFFLSPFVVHHLGNTSYGIWTVLTALVGYLGLLDFGVRGAVTRYVAHYHAVHDSESASSIVSAGFMMYGLLGTAAVLIAGLAGYLAPALLNIPEAFIDDTRIVMVVGGVTVAVTLLGGVFGGVIVGLQRFDITSGVEITVTSVRTVSIVFALLHGYGLVSLAVIHLGGSVLSGVAAWALARRLYPEMRIRLHIRLWTHARKILSFSVFLSLIHIAGMIIYYTDVVVISLFLPVSLVTFYAIAGNLSQYASQLSSAISMPMTPRISASASSGKTRIGEDIVRVARVATLVTAPIAATFWIRGESFINLWMGPEYGPASGEVLRILAFITLLAGARAVTVSSIIGLNMHRTLIRPFAVEAVANVVLSVSLIKPLGLSGVALGTLIPGLIVGLGYIPRCLSKTTGTSANLFILNAWLLPIAACVPFALATILMETYLPAKTLIAFFAQVIGVLPLVAIGATVLCASPAERKQLGEAARKLVAMMGRATGRK